MKLSDMINHINTYFTKVQAALGSGIATLVFEEATLAVDASKTYDIKTVFSNHALYDLRSCRVSVLVKDVDVGSPTVNMYTNSEAVISTAIDAIGNVVVNNFGSASAAVIIRIDGPTKLKA